MQLIYTIPPHAFSLPDFMCIYPRNKIYPLNYTHSLSIIKLVQSCKEIVKRCMCCYDSRRRVNIRWGRGLVHGEKSYTP